MYDTHAVPIAPCATWPPLVPRPRDRCPARTPSKWRPTSVRLLIVLQPLDPLPNCLNELIEQKILRYEGVEVEHSYKGMDAQEEEDTVFLEPDAYLLPFHVRKMATIHMTNLRKIFKCATMPCNAEPSTLSRMMRVVSGMRQVVSVLPGGCGSLSVLLNGSLRLPHSME
jgi:hypothetical protein